MDCVALLNNLQQGSGGTVANVVKGGGPTRDFWSYLVQILCFYSPILQNLNISFTLYCHLIQ